VRSRSDRQQEGAAGAGSPGAATCADVARRLAADGDGAAPHDPEISGHLQRCRHCREYESQLRLLGTAARDLAGSAGEDRSAVRRLEREILEPRLKPR